MVKKQFVVVGLGRFGATLAATLCANGGEVLAIDIDPERVELLRDHVTHCVEANGMNREALVQLACATLTWPWSPSTATCAPAA